MTLYYIIAGIIACVCFSAFFSASEMAYSSCNELRLENAAEEGSKRARIASYILGHFDDALSAILIGNNLVNIAASSLGSVLIVLVTGGDELAWVSTVGITLIVIIFGETMPKICAKKSANRLALRNAGFVRVLMTVFKPVIWLVTGLIKLITRGMKPESEEDSEEAVEELQSIIEQAEDEAVLDEDKSQLVQAAIDFPEISASEVMTARVDMVAIDIDDDWEDIIALIEQAPFSRLPVYEDGVDNIIGVLYLNHFLKAMTENGHADIRDLLMPACYVYKTMKLPAVLNTLRKARQHLAIVSDEYGGTLGVISLEDVLEQLVGEIWDETDTVEQEIVRRSNDELECDGDMLLDDLIELAGIDEGEIDAESETVGGWTVECFGSFPEVGDSFERENLRITVLAMDGRRVERVLVHIEKEQEE